MGVARLGAVPLVEPGGQGPDGLETAEPAGAETAIVSGGTCKSCYSEDDVETMWKSS